MDALENPSNGQQNLEEIENNLLAELRGDKAKKYIRFIMAALSSIPWVGSVIGATASFTAEQDQEKVNTLQKLWLEEHRQRIKELGESLMEIFARLDGFGEEIRERIESPEYLTLVRMTFRSWDQADTKEKKNMYQKLITNAGAIKLCPDDLIRLFKNWIDLYHEAHFMVIIQIYTNPGVTRGDIWDLIHDDRPREDTSEADLFRFLIRDLSTGGVIRQSRETNVYGQFMKKPAKKTVRSSPSYSPSRVMESAFEETKPYELTELGKEFVHYVMEDVVPQIG